MRHVDTRLLHKSNIPKLEDGLDENENMADAETKDPSSDEAKKAILK